ncbi:hypothetical protein SELMODRAFT_107947 [Selaginella moellendorffii]|uniref:Pentacotripeptide-repeat region of PRORP domain-containing protein n=2 Tax=Selaginella moellendorffii TaxID=88036 RepID=D8S3R1_SELML|nr:hypothetical protein SELMODRAFT_107947 [Selaginella moellendorffii]
MPERDLVSWNSILEAYAVAGHDRLAMKTFETMPGKDLFSWSTILAMHVRSLELHLVAELYTSLKIEGITPDEIAFVCLIFSCSHAGDLDRGVHHFKSIALDHGVEPSKREYGCLLDLLARAGHLRDAFDLVANMPFEPDVDDWKSFLASCKSLDDLKTASTASKSSLELDSRSSVPYVLLTNLCTPTSEQKVGFRM